MVEGDDDRYNRLCGRSKEEEEEEGYHFPLTEKRSICGQQREKVFR